MDMANCQQAFGVCDMTSAAMVAAVRDWFTLYYRDTVAGEEDPCQRIAYTVVNKLVRTVFAEYAVSAPDPFTRQVVSGLNECKETAVQLALVGGECYVKPWFCPEGVRFTLIPRDHILIFARDPYGMPTDVGTMEKSVMGRSYYTLLERRTVDEKGFLTIENKLFQSQDPALLGKQVDIDSYPIYKGLPNRYTYAAPVGSVGLVRLRTPMLNCVDGSQEGVSVYAAAAGLIRAIDKNEYQLAGEFDRGQSRVFASSDLLQGGKLMSHLFVGLDEDPERVGLTVFSPQLREQSFLARKQEYLRNVESMIGLKRGTLSDANEEQRTATEIAASEAEHNLTVMDFQAMWEKALRQTVALCAVLGRLYKVCDQADTQLTVDWGNGVLYDEDKLWGDYKDMVARGLLRPEFALGWRFNMKTDTEEDLKAIREKYM